MTAPEPSLLSYRHNAELDKKQANTQFYPAGC